MSEGLPGVRQFYPDACGVRNAVFEGWRRAARAFAFEEYEAPTLEPLALYLEKSGEEVLEQLFQFEDKGGRAVALRPELTPSLATMVGAKAAALKRPVKWFNIGECYRYERPQKGRLRAFYQFNADILGEPGPAADAELIALLVTTLAGLGLTQEQVHVRLSDRTLWVAAFQAWGVGEDQMQAVLAILDKRERERPEHVLEKFNALGLRGQELLERIDALTQVRSPRGLRAFFEQQGVGTAIEARLQDWDALWAQLKAMHVLPFITLDMGIVRGLAYYTGFVYEAFERTGQARALAGGGRYDHLVQKLGGPEYPAAGFAMGDVTLQDCLEANGCLPVPAPKAQFFFAYADASVRLQGLGLLQELRSHGLRVQSPLKVTGLNKQLKQAHACGASHAFIFGPSEVEQARVSLKNLETGDVEQLPQKDVLGWCLQHVASTVSG